MKAPFLYRFVCFVVRIFFRLFYRLKVTGIENIPQGGAIIAPNHTSYFDPPIVAVSMKEEIHFLARDTLFRSFFGRLIERLNAHPLKRGEGNLGAFRLANRLLQENKKVLIFPEGVRSLSGELGVIKRGVSVMACRANVPIVPVRIEGAFNVWPKGQKYPFLRGRLLCRFGPPIYPLDGDKKEAEKELSRALEKGLKTLSKKNSPAN